MTAARNEADVIEAFVRHHAAIVDRLVVLCHFSQDSTGLLLDSLAAEGLPLEVLRDDRPLYDQSVVMTRLVRHALERHDGELVLPLDADEFLAPAESGGDVRAALEALPRDRVSNVPWRTYVPMPHDDAGERNVLRRMRHRRQSEPLALAKVVVPSAVAARPGLALSIGNHEVVDARSGGELPSMPAPGLALAHFPVRSEEQLRVKVLGSWPLYLAIPDRRYDQVFHQRVLFDELSGPGPLAAGRLQELASIYSGAGGDVPVVLDPVDAAFELALDGEPADAIQVLAATAAGLGDEVRRLSTPNRALRGLRRLRRGLRIA